MYKVLLIEDSIDDQELIKRAIQKTGFEIAVSLADNGEHALESLSILNVSDKNPCLPHLVLLDLQIPKLSGKEVLKKIRQNHHTNILPVVVFTSSKEESDLMECYQLRANSFVRKPVNADDFNQAIELILKYWIGLNEVI